MPHETEGTTHLNTAAIINIPDAIQVQVPMKLRERSGRKLVIVPEGMENARAPDPTDRNTLLVALARAHLWEELVESGRFGSIRELAESIGTDSAYAARIIGLALLAPGIVKAIADGGSRSVCPTGHWHGRFQYCGRSRWWSSDWPVMAALTRCEALESADPSPGLRKTTYIGS